MSNRARNRPDKRAIAYYSGDAPDIDAAFARLTAERREKQEPEDNGLTLNDGSVIDKRKPLPIPDHPQRGQAPR